MRVLSQKPLTAVDWVSAVAADVASVVGLPSGTLQLALQKAKEKYLNDATEILLAEIRGGNVSALSDKQYEILVPSAYQFFEAARTGEYAHNLRILASLLVGETKLDTGDRNKVGRMARRLHCMSEQELNALVACSRAFDKAKSHPEFDGYHLFIDDSAVLTELGMPYVAPATAVNSHLAELCSRGFLFMGGNPQTLGGEYFYKTHAFDEAIVQAIAASTSS